MILQLRLFPLIPLDMMGLAVKLVARQRIFHPKLFLPWPRETFAVTAGTLPTDLNLNINTGVISGRLSSDGSSEVTITMTGTGDYGEETAEAKVSISAYTLPGAPGIIGSIAKDREVQIDWTVPTHTGSINGAPRTITKYTVYWGGASGVNTNSSSKEDVTGHHLHHKRTDQWQSRLLHRYRVE